ncbi:MAG: EamA family transporter [Mycobacterium sp.]|nr:EamA family transporter [Mycobacterium sp.]
MRPVWIAGGLILLPLALIMEPALPPLTATNLVGLASGSASIGAAASYVLWFRGVARLGPGAVSMLGMMSPMTAVTLGWVVLGQSLSPLQGLGAAIVLGSVWTGQRAKPPYRRSRHPAYGPQPGKDSLITIQEGTFRMTALTLTNDIVRKARLAGLLYLVPIRN